MGFGNDDYMDRLERELRRERELCDALAEALKQIIGWRERDRESFIEVVGWIEGIAVEALKRHEQERKG